MVMLSALTYTVLMGLIIVFQGCLAIGMPWGTASMGGKFPGKYPPKMRIVAIANMVVLSLLILIVLVRAGMMLPQLRTLSAYGIWFVVIFAAMSSVMNTITPSKIERIWAPITALQLISSIIVALN